MSGFHILTSILLLIAYLLDKVRACWTDVNLWEDEPWGKCHTHTHKSLDGTKVFFYWGLLKELTVKMFGLALTVQLLQLGGRSRSEYLNDDLMRLWISGGLPGTKLIKSCPLKVRYSCFIILPMHMVWSLRSKRSNPQLKAERLTGAA